MLIIAILCVNNGGEGQEKVPHFFCSFPFECEEGGWWNDIVLNDGTHKGFTAECAKICLNIDVIVSLGVLGVQCACVVKEQNIIVIACICTHSGFPTLTLDISCLSYEIRCLTNFHITRNAIC